MLAPNMHTVIESIHLTKCQGYGFVVLLVSFMYRDDSYLNGNILGNNCIKPTRKHNIQIFRYMCWYVVVINIFTQCISV